MTNHQFIFIGSCLVMGSGVIGLPIGLLANASNSYYRDAGAFPGIVAIATGLIFAIKSLNAMLSENNEK